MAQPIRYTAETMDALIHQSHKYKQSLRKSGHLDKFSNPVQPQTPGAQKPEPVTHDAYCLKCRTKRTVETEKVEKHTNGAGRAVGKCPNCGTMTHAMKSGADAKKLQDALEANRAQTGL